ncbi:MAG: 50S ribosomal protein L3, partial [Candidatus Uhrbacteria bacterium]|nr:50S ribosomal protein L3 [Candidatus Uhrbacteria bacterium]
VSKGNGFQGVVKRHHFHGHPTSHGHKDQTRMPGSIGAGGVQHVLKGRRMAGRMGNERVTVKNLRVVDVRDGGIIALKGAVPGARNAILEMVAN